MPGAVAEAAAARFSGGWHDKYPPLHFAVLAAAHRLGRALTPLGAWDSHAAFVANRMVSLVMATATVLFVFLCGRRVLPPAAALFAAALYATAPPVVYYAKLANLEAPYLFWFALSLVLYLRVLEHHLLRDYAFLALAAAAAIATKDQAYGLYALTPVPIAVSLARHRERAEGRTGGLATLYDRRLVLATATAIAGMAVLANVIGNPSGFAAHLRVITGAASADFRMFEATPAGVAAALFQTARHLVFTLGWPAALAGALGLGAALARRRAHPLLLATLVPPLSYVLTFIVVVLYVYDRFVMPLALVLALFAGHLLATGLAHARWRRIAVTLAVFVTALAWWRGASVDLLMAQDSRYAVEDWLRTRVGAGPLVAAVGPLEYLPRMHGLRWRRLGPSQDRLRQVAPDFVVVNGDFARRADPATGERAFYDGLAHGTLGYERVLAVRRRPSWSLLEHHRLDSEGRDKIYSNLDKVSPEIHVYQRVDGPAPR